MVQRVGAGTLESCAMHGGVDDCRGGSGSKAPSVVCRLNEGAAGPSWWGGETHEGSWAFRKGLGRENLTRN